MTVLADSSSSLDESAGSDGPLHNERIKDIKIIEPKVESKSPKPGDKNKMKEAELRKSIKEKLHTGSKEYVQTKHPSDTRPVVSSLFNNTHLQRLCNILKTLQNVFSKYFVLLGRWRIGSGDSSE